MFQSLHPAKKKRKKKKKIVSPGSVLMGEKKNQPTNHPLSCRSLAPVHAESRKKVCLKHLPERSIGGAPLLIDWITVAPTVHQIPIVLVCTVIKRYTTRIAVCLNDCCVFCLLHSSFRTMTLRHWRKLSKHVSQQHTRSFLFSSMSWNNTTYVRVLPLRVQLSWVVSLTFLPQITEEESQWLFHSSTKLVQRAEEPLALPPRLVAILQRLDQAIGDITASTSRNTMLVVVGCHGNMARVKRCAFRTHFVSYLGNQKT